MRLTADKVYFIATDILGSGGHLPTGGPAIWCQLEQANFFNEFKLGGVTPDMPEIYLELEPDKLLKAMSLLKSTRAIKIKLTKKHMQPCLSFEVDLTSSTAGSTDSATTSATTMNGGLTNILGRQCVHDVPVKVLPRREWSIYGEPVMTEPDISIYLPDLKRMKHLTERYKNLDHFVRLEVHPNGKLLFKLESDLVTVSTHFKDLEVATIEKNQDVNAEIDDSPVSVRVDLRNLSLFLGADQIAPKRVLANIVRNKMLHLFLIHDAVFMQFYLPAVLE